MMCHENGAISGIWSFQFDEENMQMIISSLRLPIPLFAENRFYVRSKIILSVSSAVV
jgi:hypothetical protein